MTDRFVKKKNSKIDIVADIAGGYFRIQDLKFGRNIEDAVYLNLDGTDGRFKILPNGKKIKLSDSEYMKNTHFRIKSWGEMQSGLNK